MASTAAQPTFDSFQAQSRALAKEARALTLFKQANLSEQAFERLGELLQERTFAPNEALPSDALYFIMEGAVDIHRTVNHAVELAGSLTTNDSFGEKYLLEAQAPQETLKATIGTRALLLDGPAYDQFAKEFPDSGFALQAVLARRVLQELKKAQTNLRLLFETLKSVKIG